MDRAIKPLLTEYVQKWKQTDPFNVLCPMVADKDGNEKRGYVGCGPLAMAMIMSHYQWPLSYYSASPDETYEFHWDEVRDYAYRYATSRLTREISRAYNMDAHWTYTGTSVDSNRAPQTFENFGYKKPTIQWFSNIALNTILNKAPLVVFANGIDQSSNDRVGHMWVVDGLCTYRPSSDGSTETQRFYYFHNVWGWGGVSNGYFKMAYDVDTSGAYQYDDPLLENKTGYTFYKFAAIGRLTCNK